MKKKVINILIMVIGIILIVVGILIANKYSKDTNNDNKTNNNNTEEKVNKISTFEISMFEASTSTPKRVDMSFKLENISNETIDDKYLYINLYDGDKLIYTYGYKIENLASKTSIYIEANPVFEYEKITKYEFSIDEEKIVVEPTNK